jgi:hypothetical protein
VQLDQLGVGFQELEERARVVPALVSLKAVPVAVVVHYEGTLAANPGRAGSAAYLSTSGERNRNLH